MYVDGVFNVGPSIQQMLTVHCVKVVNHKYKTLCDRDGKPGKFGEELNGVYILHNH